MKITQIVAAGATAYERKSQKIDFAALAPSHDVSIADDDAQVLSGIAHLYAPATIDRRAVARLAVPFVTNARITRRRFSLRRAPQPRHIVTPLNVSSSRGTYIPEAVADVWFDTRHVPGAASIGSYGRPSVMHAIERAMSRIDRFRDDITWNVFDRPPEPEEMAHIGAWVDPATEADDYDGFVAEALAAGLPVVATRTPINVQRLENGRSGLLVPLSDPNELTHAILAALFKPELSADRREAARQTAGRFRIRHRLRALEKVYENLSE